MLWRSLSLKLFAFLRIVFLISTFLEILFFSLSVSIYPASLTKFAFAYESGDAIVVGSIADARNLVPILASDSASGEIVGLLFNGLVKYGADLDIVGDLAESWEFKDDCRVIIFNLRRDVCWHDGKPFTARDVEFTYQKLIDPEVRTPYSGDFERVKSFKVLDDYTIV